MSGKKKLMPKSAMFVRKYEKTLRLGFASFLMVLTLLFIFHSPQEASSVGPSVRKAPRGGIDISRPMIRNGDPKYKLPTTDRLQGIAEHPKDGKKKEKAVYITLARNRDLMSLVQTIRHVEDRFNNRYHYDWVFLNDEDFTEEFVRLTSALVSGRAKYGKIAQEHWRVPEFIDKQKLEKQLELFRSKPKIPYGGSIPYRHMCRFQSGFFYRHELLDEYDYYWRVDTDITVFCDIQYDIFKFLRENNKKYGFILSVTEYQETIPTLWQTVKEFSEKFPQHINKNNLMKFISDNGGLTYNGCHFWTNFEVGSLNFWRSEAYTDFFNYLDQSGGFFYERWGDAPVHSIAASLLLDQSEIHFFDGLGFHHPNFLSCPYEEEIRLQNQCICNPKEDHTWWTYYFCTRKYFNAKDIPLPKEIPDYTPH
ncbi:Alpha-1,2 mannosyltransferase KTR1 [Nakaseomyces bracarensis]|uniref:Alpha-1,2 mannosyltransferase KTR1 n=1 Tax=Nakaseomyces bracarensis TaxID=273131 RepID=A0ABR4P150_9SACH